MAPQKDEEKISFYGIREMFSNAIRIGRIIWFEKRSTVITLVVFFVLGSSSYFIRSGARALLINDLVEISGSGVVETGLIILLILFIIAEFVPAIVFRLQGYFSKIFWFFLEEKIELLLLKRRSEIDVALHEDPKHRDLLNKVSESGVWRVQNFVDRQFYIFQNILEVIFASVVLIFSDWWIFILLFVGTIPELVVEIKYGRSVWGIYSGKAEVRRRFWDLRRHFDEMPSIIELKIFQNAQYFLNTIREIFRNFRNEEKKNETKRLWQQLASIFVGQITVAIATTWFVLKVIDGDILIGTLTFILTAIADLRQSLGGLFSNLGRQYQDSLFVSDTFKIVDLKPLLTRPEKGIEIDKDKTPEIVFENVSFGYPGNKKMALKNFSLSISPGDKLALVGINGAGKTTLVKLLCRFYDPDKGRITINGHDIKEIDLETWYRQLGVIFQDYAHYHFLVKEAIAIGRSGSKPSIEKIKDAAKAAEADIFIEEWDKNYEQMLGKEFTEGVEPSIGQWQKLALARTFYRDPRILILDEPTSSIDAEAEAKIFEKLESLPKDRTVILISHRFSTVRQANKIAVVKNGELKELGDHKQLLKLNKIYAKLFKLQAKGYK